MKLFLFLCLLTTNVFAKEILLTSKNSVSLRGPVMGVTTSAVMLELTEIAKTGNSNEPIYLVLNTPGGSVFAGLNLMQYANTLRRPVHVVSNFAASMGFHILQNSPVRYVTKFGTIMSHRASGGFEGDIPQQVNSRFKHIVDLIQKMDDQVISKTKGKYNRKSYMELIRDEYWAVGANAVKDGFADEVVELKCDESLNGTSELTVEGMFGQATITFSKCPLFPQPLSIQGDVQKTMELLNKVRPLEF